MNFNKAFNVQERQIISGYLSLMEEKPHDKITVKELTARSSIARTTFYRFFADTYDLLERLELYLLDELVLYRPHMGIAATTVHDGEQEDNLAGKPFESIRRFFQTGIRLRTLLRPIMGDNGDPYFKDRLAKRLRSELNSMMNDEGAPSDEMRSYYVAAIAASYIGLLDHVAAAPNDGLLDGDRITSIANSMRVAYFRSDSTAPAISDRRLFGA